MEMPNHAMEWTRHRTPLIARWAKTLHPPLSPDKFTALIRSFSRIRQGKKVAVVLPVEDFDDLIEDLSDLAAVAERCNEERFTLDPVKQRLIAQRLLPN